jgi:hypothetical protein
VTIAQIVMPEVYLRIFPSGLDKPEFQRRKSIFAESLLQLGKNGAGDPKLIILVLYLFQLFVMREIIIDRLLPVHGFGQPVQRVIIIAFTIKKKTYLMLSILSMYVFSSSSSRN